MDKKELGKKSKDTTYNIIHKLEENGFSPVIARNYEEYPDFDHDIDLFIDGKLDKIIQVLRLIAKNNRWDRLTLCKHYANFKDDVLNIYVFRFHNFNPLETLQVDLFGGLILFGLPLLSNYEICSKRKLEKNGRFYTMEPELEQGYRIFQIQSLNRKKDALKILKYSKRVCDYELENPGKIKRWGQMNNLGDLSMAINDLKKQNMKSFNKRIQRAKLKFFLLNLLKNPFTSIRRIIDRKTGLKIQEQINPCGPKLILEGSSIEIRKTLDFIVNKKALPGWSSKEDLRERGWAMVSFKENNTKNIKKEKLLKNIFERHEIIYSSEKYN